VPLVAAQTIPVSRRKEKAQATQGWAGPIVMWREYQARGTPRAYRALGVPDCWIL